VEKIVVETTGSFMLVDPISGETLMPGEENTVPRTSFINERIEAGQLREPGATTEAAPKAPSPPEANTQDNPGGDGQGGDALAPNASDADGDGHDDKTGEFVEGNAGRRGRRTTKA
jgi:hypothetical protein